MESESETMSILINFFAPAVFLRVISVICDDNDVLVNDPARKIAHWLFPLALVQFFGWLFLLFVSFHDSPIPSKQAWWIKNVPYVQFVLTKLIFIYIPVIVVVSTLLFQPWSLES